MASTENIKRVISNPDNQMRESKITKIDDTDLPSSSPNEALEDEVNKLNLTDTVAPVATVDSRMDSEADSSLSDENNHGGAATATASSSSTDSKIMQRTISNESNKSDSTGEARASIGNWGWFEDVHGHESVFLPGLKLEGEGRGEKSEKKKGGLLQMGSELMSDRLYSSIEPQRGKFIYVGVCGSLCLEMKLLHNGRVCTASFSLLC